MTDKDVFIPTYLSPINVEKVIRRIAEEAQQERLRQFSEKMDEQYRALFFGKAPDQK